MSSAGAAADGRVQIAIAVVRSQGRYLIGLRPDGVPLAGYWEFPGGKVHAGETPAAAAVRECQEETGLLVSVVGQYLETAHDYAHAAVQLHFFACELCGPAREPLATRWRWVTAEQLAEYRFPPANSGLLAQLQATAS